MEKVEAVVVGAGFAGAGTGRELKRRGIDTVVLERNERVGEPWRGRYDSLRLNTLRWQSHMPGRRIPRSGGRWVPRDRVVEYLEEYVREEELPIEYGIEATRIDRADGRWTVHTPKAEIVAEAVVIAPGYDREPKLPDVPGIEGFGGDLIHASAYRNPEPYSGKDVLVISAGNTGSEIAYELSTHGAARVRSSMRSVPNMARRDWGPVPGPLLATGVDRFPIPMIDRVGRMVQHLMFGDLSANGIPRPTYGLGTNLRERSVAPVIDAGFVDAVKRGQIEILPAVEAFDGEDVVLADGRRIQPEAVIAATGYWRALEGLVGHLDVLKPDGRPTHNATPGPPNAPGIYFVGYETLVRGQLPATRTHAKRVARAVARHVA